MPNQKYRRADFIKKHGETPETVAMKICFIAHIPLQRPIRQGRVILTNPEIVAEHCPMCGQNIYSGKQLVAC